MARTCSPLVVILLGAIALRGPACSRRDLEVTHDFVDNLDSATLISPKADAVVVRSMNIGGDVRDAIRVPPRTELHYSVLIPQKARLELGCAAAPGCWERRGDGVLFEVLVTTGSDREVIVHSRYIDAKANPENRKWFDDVVNLTGFEGQRVTISLATKPGPADDSRCDIALWSRPRLFGLAR